MERKIAIASVCGMLALFLCLPCAFSFDAGKQIEITVDKESVKVGRPVTVKVFAKSDVNEEVVFASNRQYNGVFGAIFFIDPAGKQIGPLGVAADPSFNPALNRARIIIVGPQFNPTVSIKLLAGDQICFRTIHRSFSAPGTYSIIWVDGVNQEHPYFDTQAIKTFTVEVVK